MWECVKISISFTQLVNPYYIYAAVGSYHIASIASLNYFNFLYNRLMFLMERGIIDKWYGQSYLDEKMCSSEVEGDEGLELMDLFTVLLVAGCGVGLAAVVLGFEICRYKMLSHMKRSIEGKDL